jgi:uncharacterized membrane protein
MILEIQQILNVAMSVLYSMSINTIHRLEPKTKRDNMCHKRYKIGRSLNGTLSEVYVYTSSSLDGRRYSVLLTETCDPLYHILLLLRRNLRTEY